MALLVRIKWFLELVKIGEDMKIIKNINNNVCLCIDGTGKQVVAFGKGIGFIKAPSEVPLSKIERTFYNVDVSYLSFLKELPNNVLEAAIQIIDMVEKDLMISMVPSSIIALADHIYFAMKRKKGDIKLNIAIQQDLFHLYPKQIQEAKKSLAIIKELTGISLPQEEVGLIALHFINLQVTEHESMQYHNKEIIDGCTCIVEKSYRMKINQNSFNYSRFVTHLEYILHRDLDVSSLDINQDLFQKLQFEYPEAFQCAKLIKEYFYHEIKITLNEEEILYLMLHINRLCNRNQ